ncbi:MAG: HNH endonuclease signature motif containing protein [Acetobacterales bacterium]
MRPREGALPERWGKVCATPGCERKTTERHCPACRKLKQGQDRRRRGSAAARLYGHAWRKARAAFLWLNPLCSDCAARGETVPATEVDHVKPHRGDRLLFWDRRNWQPLCKPCHSRKTAEENGWGGGRSDL